HEDGSCCFTQGRADDGTWHRFHPSAEEIELARRRLAEERNGRSAACVVAARVLARAALDALAAVTGTASGPHSTRPAYELLNVENRGRGSDAARRLRLLRDTLERLLDGPLPHASPQHVQRMIQERVQAALAALPAAVVLPSPPLRGRGEQEASAGR